MGNATYSHDVRVSESTDVMSGKSRLTALHPPRIAWTTVIFVAPAIAFFGVFALLPNLLQFVFAFTDWNLAKSEINFIGLENFRYLIEDGTFTNALRATGFYAITVIVVQTVLGLGFAVALERPTRTNLLFRTLLIIPVLLSPLAVGYLFAALLGIDGPLNSGLGMLIGSEVRIEWLAHPDFSIFVAGFIHAWKWFGISMVIYLANLVAIPKELIEAAAVDGASRWKRFWHVKWALLAPAVTVNMVLTVVATIQTFDIIFVTTRGGPGRRSEVLNMVVYREFGAGFWGSATAMTLVVLALVILIVAPLLVYLRSREIES